ncbi:dihydrodipicolinate synthase family protein [Pseudoroseicyclus aestuarii]|uniref:4-hydroxy-tetrahydrodipicolinate synthase n=1 Tax=Pseudoroseicyclus aestuarii TaxID=1795041 RepID=A0A318SWY7_9RHOB|nr:dihydrodipicolinate synthase family protein [Pseudoroseicyclus aestuarii]PYE84906.1 4-hydroxy-tetrahydrodipicolinate synthase [Pseudoroseicyclus aestuarii]
MTIKVDGIIPVMLTPFDQENKIDWASYERLIEWYIERGATALFAVCQSSEMQFLSPEESVALARFTVEKVNGRVPVVASGHISDTPEAQARELCAIAETGVDGVVLVTNRLAGMDDGPEVFKAAVDALLEALPKDLTLGLYECPAPFRRLLSDEELLYCAQTGRFALLKDVSCDLETVTRRVALVKDTPLGICNANAAIAWPAMQAGSTGFCGVFTNIHPDLYRWLRDHGAEHPEFAEDLATFLVLAAQTEPMGYPKMAKHYLQREGVIACPDSRVHPGDIFERFWGLSPVLDRIAEGTQRYRDRIAALPE